MTTPSLLSGVRLQFRVIGALIMREIHTRYGRENIGFGWIIGEPIVFTFGVVLLWSVTRGGHEHGISVIAFVLTGYTPMVMWRSCFSQSVNAIKANGSLLYHRQISFLDVLTARVLLEVAGSILTFVISIATFAIILDLIEPPDGRYDLMIGGWAIYAWYCFATALIVASITEMSHIAEKLSQIFGYINIPLCGAFWMVDWLPAWLHPYVLWIPSVSAFEMIRTSFFGDAVKTFYEPAQACFVCATLTMLGLIWIRKARNHLTVG